MTEQNIDIVAVIAQINTLKQQRDNAMDDVAVLMGQVESLKKQNKDFQDVITTAANQSDAPRSTDGETAGEAVGTSR